MGVVKTSRGSGGQQLFHGEAQGFGGHIVQVAGELGHLVPGGVLGLAPQGTDAVHGLEILGTHAAAGLFHPHHRGGAEGGDKMLEERRAGGGAQLPLDRAAVGGHALEDVGGGGGGHRQDAVGAPHLAAAHVYRGAQHLVRGQLVEEQAHRGDVGYGVQGAHLVEVDLLHRHAVGAALRLADELIHGQHVLSHGVGQVQVGEDVADLPHPRVVVMAMAVVVRMVVVVG